MPQRTVRGVSQEQELHLDRVIYEATFAVKNF